MGGSATGGNATGGSATGGTATTGGTGPADASTGGSSSGGANGADAGDAGAITDPPCDSTCHFVRDGATGAADGSSWTDAWDDLPATLERGHRYYVAGGTYASYDFDDAAGATITIIHATAERHGSDVGWQDSFGGSPSQFGPLSVSAADYFVDGTVAGGITVVGEFQGSVVSVSADDVTLRFLDMDGNFMESAGQQTDGACTGLDVAGDRVTVESSVIHDVADDGVSASGVYNLRLQGNTIHALHACGTDGGCGPCYNGHSDGIETYNVKQSQFIGNFVYDVRSTSTFFFGNWADTLGNGPSEYCEDMLIANNVFYAPEVGLVAYIQDAARVDVFQNVFWGLQQGSYGGLSIGPNVTALRLFNNVILSINTNHTGGAFNATEHESDYNVIGVDVGQWPVGTNDKIAADPAFVGIPGIGGPAVTDPSALDFRIQAGSAAENAGVTGSSTLPLPTTDFLGVTRGSPPDDGAFEL